jgi:IS30 family transposase
MKVALSKEVWQAARERWESVNISHEALALELGVTKQAVSGQASRNKWVKINVVKTTKNVVKSVVKSNVDNIKKTASKSTLPKKNNPEIKENVDTEIRGKGQPTKYLPEYAEQAYNYCLLGATDEKLAIFFNVDVRTIGNWKVDNNDFFQALREGKEIANMDIAKSLFNRAKGYVHIETKASLYEGEFVTIDLDKHYPPETAAIKMWLYNRDPENWRDRQEVTSTIKLDKELLEQIESQFISRMLVAHERQKSVLIERGITIDQE